MYCPFLWAAWPGHMVAGCYCTMAWHCILMYTAWLPGYPKSSFQAPCHEFQLEWGSGHQAMCLIFVSTSNGFWFVQVGKVVLRQSICEFSYTIKLKFWSRAYVQMGYWRRQTRTHQRQTRLLSVTVSAWTLPDCQNWSVYVGTARVPTN